MSTDVYLQNEFPNSGQRQRVTASYTRVNHQLIQNAHARGITVVDVGGENCLRPQPFHSQSQLVIDGRTLDLVDECWVPNCASMPDHHVGTRLARGFTPTSTSFSRWGSFRSPITR